MAVDALARQRDEEIALAARCASRSRRRARVRRDRRRRACAPSISCATSSITPRSAAARARRSGRRTGARSPATSWPCSWPLPQITTTSPGCASASASPIAARRSASTVTSSGRASPATISARIASGSSERGLSLVTYTRSAPASAAAPIRGRFARSRSPPAPKTQMHATARRGARAAQHRLDARRGVRVVDDDGERLIGLDGLEAPGRRGDRRRAGDDRVGREVDEQRQRDRAQQVLDVEAPAQRALDRERPARRLDLELHPGRAELDVASPHVGGHVDAVAQLGGQRAARGVVGVDRARAAAVEELGLGLEVRLHRAVEVEVVLREVREADGGEADALEPPHRDRDRGGLEHAGGITRVAHAREQPVQVGRLGRRQRERLAHAADARLDRAEQAAPPAGRVEHGREQEGRRRLAVRAGDADDRELLARAAAEHVRERAERRAHPLGAHLRQGDAGERTLDEQGAGAPRDGERRQVVPVARRPGDAGEERPGRDEVEAQREV